MYLYSERLMEKQPEGDIFVIMIPVLCSGRLITPSSGRRCLCLLGVRPSTSCSRFIPVCKIVFANVLVTQKPNGYRLRVAKKVKHSPHRSFTIQP